MSAAKQYRVLQPMRFILNGGPGDETLPAGTTVDSLRVGDLGPEDARALTIQREWHKKRRLKGSLVPFMWRGKARQGVLGGDRADLKAVSR